jgi:hypothetical protein
VWLIFELQVIFTLLLTQPAVLGKEPVTIPLVSRDDKALRERLHEAARSPTQNVVLALKDVAAKVSPEGSWEVYVEPAGAMPDAQGPYLVGVVSLFDRGNEPADFVFVLDNAMTAAGKKDLQVRFVPTSGVVIEGRPQTAEVRSTVTIGEISLGLEAAAPQ